MGEKQKTTVKGFRIPEELIPTVDKLIEDSGKDDRDWFIDVVQKIATNELTLDKENIPVHLKKHFSSDITTLKDATNLIISTFLLQMNRIAIEKGNWNEHFQNTILEYDKKAGIFKQQIGELEQTIQLKDEELNKAQNDYLQLHNKVEGFDKLEVQLKKNIESLELEKEKSDIELQGLKNTLVQDKEEYMNRIQDLNKQHKEEKDRLNQEIVDTLNKVKETEPIRKENEQLREEIRKVTEELRDKSREYEINLTRNQEQAEINKQKALLERERELQEQSRVDLIELYKKIEELQNKNQSLQLENALLRNQKGEDTK